MQRSVLFWILGSSVKWVPRGEFCFTEKNLFNRDEGDGRDRENPDTNPSVVALCIRSCFIPFIPFIPVKSMPWRYETERWFQDFPGFVVIAHSELAQTPHRYALTGWSIISFLNRNVRNMLDDRQNSHIWSICMTCRSYLTRRLGVCRRTHQTPS